MNFFILPFTASGGLCAPNFFKGWFRGFMGAESEVRYTFRGESILSSDLFFGSRCFNEKRKLSYQEPHWPPRP